MGKSRRDPAARRLPDNLLDRYLLARRDMRDGRLCAVIDRYLSEYGGVSLWNLNPLEIDFLMIEGKEILRRLGHDLDTLADLHDDAFEATLAAMMPEYDRVAEELAGENRAWLTQDT